MSLRSASCPPSALLLALIASGAAAQGPARPFPVDKTVDIKEPGQVFTVEGRVVIDRKTRITVLRDCILRAVGEEATIVLDGELKMKAVTGGRVRLENVWIEVTPECKDLTLSDVEWFGGGGLRTAPETSSRAKMFLISTWFYQGSACRITASDGKVEVQDSHFDEPLEIVGAPRSERQGCNAVIQLEGCHPPPIGESRGMMGGLSVTGGKEVLVRNCDLAGEATSFRDCPKLVFDGNNARSGTTTITQSAFGAFKDTEIVNCDFRTKLVFSAPPDERDPTKAERMLLDHCWFGGRTDPDTIARDMITDQRKDPAIPVLCTFAKICPTPLKLAGGFGG